MNDGRGRIVGKLGGISKNKFQWRIVNVVARKCTYHEVSEIFVYSLLNTVVGQTEAKDTRVCIARLFNSPGLTHQGRETLSAVLGLQNRRCSPGQEASSKESLSYHSRHTCQHTNQKYVVHGILVLLTRLHRGYFTRFYG